MSTKTPPGKRRSKPATTQVATDLSPLGAHFLLKSMEGWGCKPWQMEVALISPVFRTLLHQVHVSYPENGDLQPLDELWEAAGSPADRAPGSPEFAGRVAGVGEIVDRGDQGVWAEFETAAWYAEFLCEHIEIAHVLEMCY